MQLFKKKNAPETEIDIEQLAQQLARNAAEMPDPEPPAAPSEKGGLLGKLRFRKGSEPQPAEQSELAFSGAPAAQPELIDDFDSFDIELTDQPQTFEPAAPEQQIYTDEPQYLDRPQEEYDPEKESIFYFGLPKDPPREPEPIHVDRVPSQEPVSRRRYKKRNKRPVSAAAKAIITFLCIAVFFALLMVMIWFVFPS